VLATNFLSFEQAMTDDRIAASTVAKAQPATKTRGGYFPSQLTAFNRDGKVTWKVGSPGMHGEPALSPDSTRIAATYEGSIRIYDKTTGSHVQNSPIPPALARHLAWSPDGQRIAFVGVQDDRYGIYQISADGSGPAKILYRNPPGEPIFISDWSDERFMFFQSRGVLFALLVDQGKAVELVRGKYVANHAKLSPDRRYLAYWSDESGRGEVYVRSFDPSLPGFPRDAGKWTVSSTGARSPIYWGARGRELYFRASPAEVMVAEVKPPRQAEFQATAPKLLFRAVARDGSTPVLAGGSISPDGKMFLFNVRVPPARKVSELNADALQRYVGRFMMSTGTDLLVSLESGQLVVQGGDSAQAQQRVALLSEGPDRFFVRTPEYDRDYEFVTDDKGAVIQVIEYFGASNRTGRRR